MKCYGCCLLALPVAAVLMIFGALFGGYRSEGEEEEERAAIVTFLMD